jgi:uncharacterized repeat protein (TIGR03803 family)
MKILRISLVIVLVVVAGRAFHANAQTETNLYSFSGPPDGEYPSGGLVRGRDGNFYGTTFYGGERYVYGEYYYYGGTIFRISPSGTYTNFYSFAGPPTDGAGPDGGLVQGSDGDFYGTCGAGGANDLSYGGDGTVFRFSPSGTYTTLYSFAGGRTDGYGPSGLVQGSNGIFYGTTTEGGTGSLNNGTVFWISANGSETVLYSFGSQTNDGDGPEAGLVQGSDGNFYGTTYEGGTSTNCGYRGCGTVFRISPSGSETNLYSFGSSPNDGYWPEAGLVQGSDGNLYGTTGYGGAAGQGTVFRISPSGSYTSLYSFVGPPSDGTYPVGSLVQGSDGNFYGTTDSGGTNANCINDCGTVFRISASGTYTSLYSFGSSPTDGLGPTAGLVQGSDGNFYGTTGGGGTYGDGTVFKLDVGLGPIGSNCTFSINPTNAVFTAAGGSGSVSVTAIGTSCLWTATSNDAFITITSATNGTGDGTISYSVAANTSSNALTGTLTIAGQTFTVVQSGDGCDFLLDSTSASYGSTGGSSNIMVTANGTTNCPWMAGSNSGFITITSGSSGSGDGTVSYFVAPNPNAIAQTGSMIIAGQTYTVTEAAAPCNFLLPSTSATFTAAGGSDSVTVTANGTSCIWTATSNNAFILINSGSIVSGDGTVSYSVAANTNASEQMGTITVAGQTYTVFEEGAPSCTYALTSAGANFGAAGGSCNVGVTAANGCAWTASTTNGWITVTAGSSGSGTGTLSYSVAANTSAASRSGTMTIGGQTFTINQLGATPVTYSFSTPVQTLKTKLNKKTGVTTTNCTVAVKLVVANTGTTATAKSTVLLWLDQGCTFSPSVGLAPLTEKVSALKEGKSHTIKVKTKKLTEDLAGTFIFATDAGHNILASVEVPSP